MPIFLINLLVGIALSLASTLIQQMFAQDEKQKVQGVRGTLQTGGDNPLAFIMGLYSTGGQLEYAGTWGNDGETPNAFYTKVISLSDVPIQGVSGIYVGGERVSLGLVEHVSRGWPVLEYRVDGKDHLWLKFYNGMQTSADAFLLSTFGSDPDRPYLSSQIGRGTAYCIATALVNRELFSGLPEYLFEVEGIKLYDPRLDTTAGGSGAHRVNDPSTWTFSSNPVVAIYNILLGIYFDGDWVYGPQKTTQAQLPYANWSAEMNKCDASVPLQAGGSETRFRFGFEVVVDEEPQAVIGELLKACEGRIAEVGGFYKILVAEPNAPVRSITDSEIVISEGQSFEPFPGLENTYNAITATYPEPEEAWQNKEAPARYNLEFEDEDDDNRLPFSTDYKAVPFPLQVQRIMEAALLETRQFRKHSFTGLADWWEYEPLDVFTWTSERNGYTDKQFLITVLEDIPNGNQIVGSQETDPADFSGWVPEDEIPYDTSPIVISRPPPQPMTGWNATPYTLVDTDADARRPGILVEFAGGLDDVRAVQIQVRLDGDTVSPLVLESEFPYTITVVDPTIVIVGNAILPNTEYEIRGKFIPYSSRLTEWSSWLPVTTPDVKMGSKDITVDLTQLTEEIAQQLNWIKAGVRSTLEAFKRIGTIIEESDLDNYNLRAQLHREIEVQLGILRAGFIEVIEVAVGPGSAIATAIQSLYAAMGGNTSEVNIRWEAVAAPGGYAARYAIQAAVNDGSFRAATFFMDVPSNPLLPTRIVLDADQVLFTDTAGSVVLPAVVIEGGELKFVGARAGRISDVTGVEMILDFDNKEIYME